MKRAEQKAATRAKLTSIAKAAFHRLGYEEVTFRALATEAGVSTGAFFSCWDSKAEMFAEVMERPAPDMPDFLARVASVCAGYPGQVGSLARDAEQMRRDLIGSVA